MDHGYAPLDSQRTADAFGGEEAFSSESPPKTQKHPTTAPPTRPPPHPPYKSHTWAIWRGTMPITEKGVRGEEMNGLVSALHIKRRSPHNATGSGSCQQQTSSLTGWLAGLGPFPVWRQLWHVCGFPVNSGSLVWDASSERARRNDGPQNTVDI